jgi:hypothetical protein
MVLFKITRKRVVVFSAGMLLLLLFAFAGGPAIVHGRFPMIHSAEDPDAVPIVDAKELLTQFENDANATLKRYGGRIWLRGMVTEISGPEVTLEGPPGVRCVYVSVNDQTAMQVRTTMGQSVMIEGTLSDRGTGRLHLFRPWKRRV